LTIHLVADSMAFIHSLHSHFSGGLRETIFSAKVRFGRSRSSRVIDFGTNRKRVWTSY